MPEELQIPEDLKEMYDKCGRNQPVLCFSGWEMSQMIERMALLQQELQAAKDVLADVDATLCECRNTHPSIECNCDIHAAHKLIARALLNPPADVTAPKEDTNGSR